MSVQASRVIKLSRSGQIKIPVEFQRRLKIGRGTLLKIVLRQNYVEITHLNSRSDTEITCEYTRREIARFVAEDKLDSQTAARAKRLLG